VKTPIHSADPLAGYLAAKKEIDAAVARVLASGRYILGAEAEAFEREFAAYLGCNGAVGVANGTDALELALRALGVGPGDKVVTVANTVSATAAAIQAVGAEIAFVDVEPGTMLMEAAQLERVLKSDRNIKAVVPVHLYGQPCAMAEIIRLARAHGAAVVEDCAQAHGAVVGGRKAGAWGDLAAFSFYPTKNLGALGDGGAVTGGDAALLGKVRLLRQYGWRTRYVSEVAGRNSRLDEIQAAILRARLPRLDEENAHRARLAACYADALKAAPLRLPVTGPDRTHVWHQFVVRTPRRDELQRALAGHGVHCGILYPVPLHRQPAFAQSGSLPETERACAEVLSLPLHLGLKHDDVQSIAEAVKKVV
jgi:dTDP-4-amino-4,6-dideoxygalactose transaminase